MTRSLLFLSLLLASSCSKKQDEPAARHTEATLESGQDSDDESGPDTSSAAPPRTEGDDKIFTGPEALIVARQGAQGLGKSLKDRLMQAMSEGGPEGALQACAEEAGDLTAKAANRRLRVGRSTLRLRNQENAKAPAWVRDWLVEQGERKAEGLAPLEEVVDGTARVLIPLTVGGLCLTCHGDVSTQSDEMKARLASRYPADQAVGYALGDLRGVLWAEVDLAPADPH